MEEKEELKVPIPLKIICFLIPLVGLIIYVCNVQKNRKYANQCGIVSLIGFILPIIIVVLGGIGIEIYSANKVKLLTSGSSNNISSEEKKFNEQLEIYQGVQSGSSVKALISKIQSSNFIGDDYVTIKVNGYLYTSSTFIYSSSKYDVKFKKGSNGKINTVEIVEK